VIDPDSDLYRIESAAANLAAEYLAALARTRPERNATLLEIDGAVALFAGSDSPLTKCTGIGLDDGFGADAVDAIERFYHQHGSNAAFEISPLAPATLEELLAGRGYGIEYRLMVMTRSLDGIDEEAAGDIEIIGGDADGDTWARTIAAGFSGLSPELLLEIFQTNAAIASVTRWLARVDGEIAGGGTLSIHEGVAHLFGTSVLPEFRRRGVQRALLGARLRFARESGCDIATVVASPQSDSERNLVRNGFEAGWERRVWGAGCG
jgi:ribosomal protein S18 acetylase RimI-like enzyme